MKLSFKGGFGHTRNTVYEITGLESINWTALEDWITASTVHNNKELLRVTDA